jgi:hypothetical protein
MMPRLLLPVGRWKVDADSANDQATIRLSGRAFSDASQSGHRIQTVLLTPDQAHELVSSLNLALLELELQRTADLARRAEGEGTSSEWDYSCPSD